MAINEQTRRRVLDFVKTDKFKTLSQEQKAPFRTALLQEVDSSQFEEKPRGFDVLNLDLPPDVAQKRPFLQATQKTLKEGFAVPALNLLNLASLGTIGGVARAGGQELPKPETLPGKVLAGAAGVTGLVKSPVFKGLGALKLPGISKLSPVKRGLALGATRGAVAGALFSPTEITDIKQRGKQALIGGAIGATLGAGLGLVQSNLARQPEKVNQIRKGMRDFWRRNSKEYGRLLKKAGKEGGEIDPIETLDFMEKELANKGVLDRAGQKIAAPQDKIDRALFKSYEKLRDSFIKSGAQKVPAEEVIGAGRTLGAAERRARFRPTTLGSEARRLERGIQDTFKQNMRNKGKSFDEAQKLWATFRDKFDLVDNKFKVWESNLRTGKGEQSLTRIMSSGEMRNVARIIEQETGIGLTIDKVLSLVTSPSTRDLLRTIGLLAGTVFIAKRIGETAGGGGTQTEGPR